MKNEKTKKVLKIVGDVLLYVFIAICLVGVVITITAKRGEDGAVSIFGMQMRIVITESMEKSEYTDVSDYEIKDIPVNSVVFIKEVPKDEAEALKWYSDLRVGDVLTFKYSGYSARQQVITHRITHIEEKDDGSGYIIQLEGDNKSTEDGALTQTIDTSKRNTSFDYVIGKVTGSSYIIGLFLTILKSPLGLIFIVIVPSVIIIAMEIFKIVKMANADKKAKDQEEREAQQNELDMLKKRLAELEQQKAGPPDTESSPAPEGEATEDAPSEEN